MKLGLGCSQDKDAIRVGVQIGLGPNCWGAIRVKVKLGLRCILGKA